MTDTAVEQVVAKPETKMSKARTLLRKIYASEIPEGSSIRKEFLRRGVDEIALTKAGAITYYNNLNNELKRDPAYQSPVPTTSVTDQVVPAASSEVATDEEE